MRKFVLLALLTCVALSLVTADLGACWRRRAHRCCCAKPMCQPLVFVVTISSCTCTSASGTLSGSATRLVQCYVVDKNGHKYDGTVTYPAAGQWKATFPDSPVAPCTLTVVANDGSAAAKVCSGSVPAMRGVTISSCTCTSASGTLSGSATKLVQCYVVDKNHQKYDATTVTYPAAGQWKATFPDSPVAPCTCTVVANDNSAAAKVCN